MATKNVVTSKVQTGTMTFDCDFCRARKKEGTAFVSVPIFLYSYIKVWGNKVFRPTCNNCGQPFEVTLTP